MCIIKIPTKHYLVKYVHKNLDVNPNEPIKFSVDDKLGICLFILFSLSRKNTYYNSQDHIDHFVEKIEDSYLEFDLTQSTMFKAGIFLTSEKIFYINKFLDKIFYKEIYTFISSLILYNPDVIVQYSLEDFLAIYDLIEGDDIKLETVIKKYHRYKKMFSYIK